MAKHLHAKFRRGSLAFFLLSWWQVFALEGRLVSGDLDHLLGDEMIVTTWERSLALLERAAAGWVRLRCYSAAEPLWAAAGRLLLGLERLLRAAWWTTESLWAPWTAWRASESLWAAWWASKALWASWPLRVSWSLWERARSTSSCGTEALSEAVGRIVTLAALLEWILNLRHGLLGFLLCLVLNEEDFRLAGDWWWWCDEWSIIVEAFVLLAQNVDDRLLFIL